MKVTKVPAALLRNSDNSQVGAGAVWQGPTGNGHVVMLQSDLPDSEGLITIQETYKVTPGSVGLHVRPAAVTLELSTEEAAPVLKDLQDFPASPAPPPPPQTPPAGGELPDFQVLPIPPPPPEVVPGLQ